MYYYGEFVEERARIILEASRETMDNMVKVLGIAPTDPLRIVAYNNYRHMVVALPFRSSAVSQDLQAQGMAFSDERVLLIHAFDPTVTGTVSHEFTHILVAEAAGGSSALVPAWLNEGLAEYGNIDKTDEYDAALRYGIYTRRIRPLWYQQTFSGEPEDILIAYGQGKSVVEFMVRRWGEDRITALFEALRHSRDIDTALMQVYGVDQYGMDSAWRRALGLDPLPPPEELRNREAAADSQPAPVGEDTTGEGAAPVASEQEQPEAEPTEPAAVSEADAQDSEAQPESTEAPQEEEPTGSSSPCSAPPPGASSVGLGMLGLLAAPFTLAGIPFLRRFKSRNAESPLPPGEG